MFVQPQYPPATYPITSFFSVVIGHVKGIFRQGCLEETDGDRDKEDAGHAVLTVITDKGEFVLDNQEPEVKTWTDTPYTFLKRQSQEHPMQWVSLNHRKNRKALYVSGN